MYIIKEKKTKSKTTESSPKKPMVSYLFCRNDFSWFFLFSYV